MRRLVARLLTLRVQVCAIGALTALALYGVAVMAGHSDASKLSASTPRSALAINNRNGAIVHSGPGEPVNGRAYRVGVGDR
jgi:hypothetical protein